MGSRIVQDSDGETSDGGSAAHEPGPVEAPAKGTTGQLMRGLREAHRQMLDEDAAGLQRGQYAGANEGGQPQQGTPTITVQGESLNGHVAPATLLPTETVSSDQTLRPENEEVDGESQKRKAEPDLTDEDEVCFVPARKKQRGERIKLSQTEASDRASMPPPASQESITSRASAASQRSALRPQPSPPRLQDNMSFTTTTSSATSFQGGRGARMFPALDSDSFHQRLNDMDLDQQTEPDSMPPSQEDPTVLRNGSLSQQETHTSSSLEESRQPGEDTIIKDSPPMDPSDAHAELQSRKSQDSNSQDGNEHSGFSSTLLRVEVPLMRSGDPIINQCGYPSTNGASKRGHRSQKLRETPLAEGELADGEENAVEDKIKVKTNQILKKSKRKNTAKKRGRRAKEPPPEALELETDEDGVAEERNVSGLVSHDSKKDLKNPESMPTSNGTSFVADTPSPEPAEGQPVAAQATTPGTPDKDSEGARSGKHSPLNNGKVPLRVGLSKRAHIEPLLRTVRK